MLTNYIFPYFMTTISASIFFITINFICVFIFIYYNVYINIDNTYTIIFYLNIIDKSVSISVVAFVIELLSTPKNRKSCNNKLLKLKPLFKSVL